MLASTSPTGRPGARPSACERQGMCQCAQSRDVWPTGAHLARVRALSALLPTPSVTETIACGFALIMNMGSETLSNQNGWELAREAGGVCS